MFLKETYVLEQLIQTGKNKSFKRLVNKLFNLETFSEEMKEEERGKFIRINKLLFRIVDNYR